MSCNAKRDPNGTWRIQYRWTDWMGERHKSQKRGFKTKHDAEEWLRQFLGSQVIGVSSKLADFWKVYRRDMQGRLRKTTLIQKDFIMQSKILPYFGHIPVNQISVPKIRAWQAQMMAKGYEATYLKGINNQLSCILNYAVKYYDLPANPCLKAGVMGRGKAGEREHWSVEEFKRFSVAISDKKESVMGFSLLFWTGMRLGEMLALTVGDIDTELCTINIDKSLARIQRQDVITAPKTASSVRLVTIHRELADRLRDYIAQIPNATPQMRLFEKQSKSYFEREMQRGVELSGVKRITVHGTRHSQASLCLEIGCSPLEIAKRLGHGKVATTLETYCHQPSDAQRRIAAAMGLAARDQ